MQRLSTVLIALATVALLPLSGTAQESSTRTLSFDPRSIETRDQPLIVGVGVHFGIGGEYNYIPGKSAELLKELGADSYRDDLPWSAFDHVSSVPGSYQPNRLFDFMKIATVKPLLILGHTNPQVPGGNPPLTDAGRTAFADFAVRAAKATASFQPIYEVWNEWNMNAVEGRPWLVGPGEAADPRAAVNYTALARATVPPLRQAAPDATILSGAVGVDAQWQWARAIVEGGTTKDASALSVHLYNHCEADLTKRTATEMVDRLQDLQAKLAPDGNSVPIYVTEFGWPTALKPCVLSRKAVADNIAQFLLWSSATPWMKGAWVYQLKDQGRDPNGMEANFGLYDYDYNPKPAACAVRNATRLIKSAQASRLERPFKDVFVLQQSTGAGMRLIAWTTDETIKASLAVPDGMATTATLLCNGEKSVDAGTVLLGPEPVVLDVPATGTVDLGMRLLP